MSTSHPTFRLDGTSSSLLLSNHGFNDGRLPAIAWFGDQLTSDTNNQMLAELDDQAHAFANLDERAPLSVFPQSADGYMGSPALLGRHGNASSASLFALAKVEQSDQSLTLTLEDARNALRLTKTFTLDKNSDVVTVNTTLKNTGQQNYTIDWLASATLPLPPHICHCTSQHGRWGLENQSITRPIGPGRIDIQNLHGRTGHEHGPNIICGSKTLCEDTGDAVFVHLGWSSNYSIRVERLNDGNGYIQAGVLLSPGEQVLEPNAEFDCPPLYFTKACGLNEGTQRFHRFARENILPTFTRKPRPIHANSWEAMYFDLNDADLKSLVDAAAAMGAERFVLDDGWFIGRRDDTAGLGDWRVDKAVFPNGLTPLVEHVRSKNMQFGLWFEPEMANPKSELYATHPEWALHYDQLETPLARNQLVLDVAREDVSDYLFKCISDLVTEYKIDYIKWDMNRDLVLAGDGTNPRASKQPPAVYALMHRLTSTHTELEIESCASGGARCDFGILRNTGRVWTSDNIDPIARATIQQGFARFFPPEIMGAHVGHKRAHLTGRDTDIHTRAIVALQGQFGFEIDARVLSDEEVSVLKIYTDIYKTHRDWLNMATYWQLPTSHEQLLASGQVRGDKTDALFSVVLLDSLRNTRPGSQRLRGLNPNEKYTVNLLSSNVEQLKPFNNTLPSWCERSIVSTGELLMSIGLPLPVMPPQSALLIHCTAHKG